MKAAVYHGKREVRVIDIPEPETTAGTVKVRIEYCGICGSDVHAYVHGPHNTVMQNKVMGHEYGGVVESVGDGVTRFKVGDKVTGIGIGGAFAEKWVYPETLLYHVPPSMSTREAALVEPLAVALRGVKRAKPVLGENIAVLGAGPIGLFCVAILKQRGFDNIIVSEPDEFRRKKALEMGAKEAHEPKEFVKRVRELTGLTGLHLAFECVGIKATMDDAMSLLGRGGRLLVLGALTEPYPLTIFNFFVKEITIIPSFAHLDEMEEAIQLVANKTIDPLPIATREIALDNISSEGFEPLASRVSGLVKVLVKC